MDKTALYLLIISAGLLLLYFLSIIYVWFFRYFSALTTKKAKKRLEELVSFLFDTSNKKGKIVQNENELQKLKSFVQNSVARKQSLINIIVNYGDDFIETNHELLMNLYEVTGIKAFLIQRLTSKSLFKKSLTCSQLGALRLNNTESYILKLSVCDNNNVRYNVLLALAKLGDLNGLVYILTSKSENMHISYRSIIEIISAFNGSKEDLFKKTLELCDNYIKAILIKAAAVYHIEELRENYIKYLNNNDKNLRIACVRALCGLENSDNEDYIINMLYDKEWEVRAASAKSILKIGTNNSFIPLTKATSDGEWWVRHNAACTLVLLNGGMEYASIIINGNDKYAIEAVSNAIEMIS